MVKPIKFCGKKITMEELYFTIAGCSHYFGSDFIEKGMKVKLEKEPDNEYDKETIPVKIKGLGKIGYVANSSFTVKGESMSAGRLYDKIGDKAKHAKDFIAKREAPAYIANDGKQTPMKGHPVFIAQHATATCCRECIRKWHKMQPGKELSQIQQDYLVDVIMTWIQRERERG